MKALLIVLALRATAGVMWGVSEKASLVTIDMTSGIMSNVTKEHPLQLEAQELSAIDTTNRRYYTVGVSKATNAVELYVWSLDPGHHIQTVPLPFTSQMFVGLGQAILVDPVDGTIFVMGHDPKHQGHHAMYALDPKSFNATFVADIGGSLHNDLLGASSGYDSVKKVAYVAISYNNSGAKQPALKFAAVAVQTGKVTKLSNSLLMASMSFDAQTGRMYGTVVTNSATGEVVSPWTAGAVVHRGRKGPDGRRVGTAPSLDGSGVIPLRNGLPSAPDGLARSLAYFETSSPTKLTIVAPMELTGAIGDLHTLDVSARVHYSLLNGKPNASHPYQPTDFCSAHHEACPSGATCCCEPPCGKEAYGYCYAVSDCSKIPPDGDPFKVVAYLYGVHLDTGKKVSQTPLCSIEPSNATVPQSCPWSIESAGAE